MLSVAKPRRKRSARDPFRTPLWDDDHPAMRRIDADLSSDHPARLLRSVVAHLDLTSFRCSYAGSGSLAYPAELLVAFVLFMYSNGILSPAEWTRRARHDDQAKWLLRGLQPSRSQLYTFRDRVEPFLDSWHGHVIAWAVAKGVTNACQGSLDGTFVAALASRHQLLNGRRLDRRLLLLRLLVWLEESPGETDLAGHLEELPQTLLTILVLWLELLAAGLAEAELPLGLVNLLALVELLPPGSAESWPPRLPAWVPQSSSGRKRVLQRYENAKQRLARRLEPLQRKRKPSQKDLKTMKRMKVSLTDPEAALGFDKAGTYRPLYNVLLVQATDAPLTLAWDVLSRNNDDGLLKPMMERTRQQLGYDLDAVRVDGAFVTVADVDWCERAGITVYGPARKTTDDDGDAPGAANAAEQPRSDNKKKKKQVPKEEFVYDAAEEVYYCPQGKRLPRRTQTKVKRQSGLELPVFVHQASSQDCLACPQQAECTRSPHKGRVVKRYQGEEALERLRQRMTDPVNQQQYKQRSQTVELGYADLKQHRGLRVFRCFGRQRARAQAGLVILASNGLAIMRALQRRHKDQAPDDSLQKPPG